MNSKKELFRNLSKLTINKKGQCLLWNVASNAMKEAHRYFEFYIISLMLLISGQIFGQQKLICGNIYNHTRFAQSGCSSVIINDFVLKTIYSKNEPLVHKKPYNKEIPFLYLRPGNSYIDSFKIECNYGCHPIIFINLPDIDSVNLGSIPMFQSHCLYHHVDDRNNIFSAISSNNHDRQTKRFYKKKDRKIEKYRYKYDNHKYKLERSGDNIIIDLNKYEE